MGQRAATRRRLAVLAGTRWSRDWKAESCLAQALCLPEQLLGWYCQAPAIVSCALTERYGLGEPIPSGVLADVCAAEASTQPGLQAAIPDCGLGEIQLR